MGVVASHREFGESQMTPREQECLAYIREHIAQREFSPSYDEIAARLGVASKSGVHRLVISLVAQGLITSRPNSKRSIALVAALRPTDFVEPLVKAFMAHAVPEDDVHADVLVICTPEEVRETITNVLARTRT